MSANGFGKQDRRSRNLRLTLKLKYTHADSLKGLITIKSTGSVIRSK